MVTSERRILNQLKADAIRTESLFANAGQTAQERTVVAGLLRVFGVGFDLRELVKQGPEPIDVWFRDARFQVTEVLDSGRRRNAEIKERADRIKNAQSLKELIEPGTIYSRPITPAELVALAAERATAKAQKYAGSCGDIDLLIYINLQRRHVYPSGPFPSDLNPAFMAWRSISIIMEGFSIVLWASNDAPGFIVERVGLSLSWDRLESVFPALDD